ncbi:hypothetical protein Ddc_05835 [Ditylenchus destructor]|nr:hypothetical protein Ddc_05835 [Ditylenchus destructor]
MVSSDIKPLCLFNEIQSQDEKLLLRLCHYIEVIMSSCSLCLLFWHVPWNHIKGKKRFSTHVNFAILLCSGFIFYFLHIFFILVTGAFIEIASFIEPECVFTMITWQCHILRLPIFCAIIGFSLLHLFLFLERCLATVYLSTYANSGAKFGLAATFIIIITLYLVSTLCIAFYLKRSIRRHKVVQVTSARDQTDVYFAQLSHQLSRNIPENTKR